MNAAVVKGQAVKEPKRGHPAGTTPKTGVDVPATMRRSFRQILGKALDGGTEAQQAQPGLRGSGPELRRTGKQESTPAAPRTGLRPARTPDRVGGSPDEATVGNQRTDSESLAAAASRQPDSLRPRRTEAKADLARVPSGPRIETLGRPRDEREPSSARTPDAQSPGSPQKVRLTVVDRRRQPAPASEPVRRPQLEAMEGAAPQTESAPGPARGRTGETAGETILVRFEAVRRPETSATAVPVHRTVTIPPQFHHQLHTEFLDRAKIILRDGGGEMRLTIRPQNLGSLRLSVTLEERVLKGQIVVDNETVKGMVESQLDSLLRSFREGGFDPLELRVSVAGEDGGRQSAGDREPPRRERERTFQQAQPTERFERHGSIALEA